VHELRLIVCTWLLTCGAWFWLKNNGAGVYEEFKLRVPDGRLLLYIVENDRELRRIIRNCGGTGVKLAENAVTPEGQIKLVTHLQFLDAQQVYAIQQAACLYYLV
jgi:hypothetical protein